MNLIGTHDVPPALHRLFRNAGWNLEECTFLKVVKGTGSRSPSGSSEIMFKNVRPGCGITCLWTRSRAMVALRITDEIVGLSEFETCNRRVKFCQDGEGSMCSSCHRQAIRGGYVHVEQEIFVAAFSRNDETDYGAPPVLLMPTCDFGMLLSLWRCSVKHGKYHRLAKLSMVLSGR